MPRELPSHRITAARDSHARLMRFFEESRYFERYGEPDSLFLAMGDPHELPPAGYVEAIREQLEPRGPTWFSYKTSIPEAQEAVAASLRRWRGLPFEAADIALTTGAFGAIAAAMTALLDPGDEVIINTPPWFNYDGMALARSAVPVKVPTRADFDLDLAAIEAAITPSTRLVVVNTPNNPTGRVYPAATLEALAEILTPERWQQLLVEVYAEGFTAGELRQILAFFETPTGRKVLQTETALSARIESAGDALFEEHLEEFIAHVDARLAEEFEELDGGATP